YYTVVLQVTSYKSNGQVIGSVMNDLMFIVPACSGEAPFFAGLSDPVNSTILGNNDFMACEQSSFCIDLVFTDDDPSASITVVTNAATVLPGSTLQTSGTNPLHATLCWTALVDQIPFSLFVQASDGACPISNISSNFIVAQDCTPLPVELIAFHAEPIDRSIRLFWTTGSESGSSHFEIERSGDGNDFRSIGRMNAAGHSSHINNYQFDDTDPIAGANYYRLRKVDEDGSADLSQVIFAIHEAPIDIRLQLNNAGLWSVQGIPANAEWILLDLLGREIDAGVADGSGMLEIATLPYRGGIGLLQVRTSLGFESIRIPLNTE
nr:hypothetical protein [Bacteroidota bacterium]